MSYGKFEVGMIIVYIERLASFTILHGGDLD